MDNGNFLQYAGSKLGVDVGFGKCILVFSEPVQLGAAGNFTSDGINNLIESGTIIGIIRGWHTVAGAPVGEISVERTGTSEMKLVREEIAADVLTFESNLKNRAVLADLVKAGTLDCILIDDQGNVFGEYDVLKEIIKTMKLNFSTKVTSSFQRDNATDKTIAVTVRYLVKELSMLAAGVETELINSKVKSEFKLLELDYLTGGEINLTYQLLDKATGEILKDLDAEGVDVHPIVNGLIPYVDSLAYNASTGLFEVSIIGATNAVGSASSFLLTLSGVDYYIDQVALPTINA